MLITSRPTPQAVRNQLLRLLPPAELERLWPRLEMVELSVKTVLLMPGAAVECVHFMETGTVSMISTLEDGTQIEVGLVGPEGMAGLSLLLGAPTSLLEGMVQVGGTALRLPRLRSAPGWPSCRASWACCCATSMRSTFR